MYLIKKPNSAESIFESLLSQHDNLKHAISVSETEPVSQYYDCNASFTITFRDGNTVVVDCSGVRKANSVRNMIKEIIYV